MRAAVVLCLAVMAMSASAYREYARAGNGAGALEAVQQQQQVHGDDKAALLDIATRKATCPFVGSAVAMGLLPVTQQNPDRTQPLAKVDTVMSIGNTPVGSTLGHVLKVFSTGNHAKMLGGDGKLSVPVPADSFALDFPGSQGAHAGHSGILMGDPHVIKLVTQLTAVAAKGANAQAEDWRVVISAITKLAADDNLIGSAGEFGLLLAFLEHSPVTAKAGGNTFSVSDITDMFQHKRFPAGWESWPKSALAWAKYSAELTALARVAYTHAPTRHP